VYVCEKARVAMENKPTFFHTYTYTHTHIHSQMHCGQDETDATATDLGLVVGVVSQLGGEAVSLCPLHELLPVVALYT
jgi:hypothetical protein